MCAFSLGLLLIYAVLLSSEGTWDIADALEFLALFVVVALAFVSGVFSIQRQGWKVALSGSIVVFLLLAFPFAIYLKYGAALENFLSTKTLIFVAPLLTGMTTIILTVLSKNEFK
jgi:hypothetical protein